MGNVVPLSDIKLRSIKAGPKIVTFFDGKGLYLEVSPSGAKGWRFAYRFEGKRKLLSMGVYPEVSLLEARKRREDARRLLAAGVDPGENRKAQKAAKVDRAGNSFEVVAREWFAVKINGHKAPSHASHIMSYFEKDVFPWIGGRPISDITPPELLSVARRVESRGAIATAHRVIGVCGEVFRFAVGSGRATSDPTRDLRGNLQETPKAKHRAAVTDPKKVGELLRVMEGYQGGFVVRCALLLAPLVFVRPGELRQAQWKDIDLDAAEWRFQATKTDTAHVVPLSHQALVILKDIHPLTGDGRFVFPGGRSPTRPMSNNGILAAFRSLGIPPDVMCGHGWRAVARTLLDEKLGYEIALIEKQLGHKVKDLHGEAYNRTAFLEKRREMMQAWSDYLDGLKGGEKMFLVSKKPADQAG